MTCGFTLDHYRELLAAARTGGYRFSFFDRLPQQGDLLLRHDVDLSLEAALALAEIEAELGVSSTYFLMAARSGEESLARLRALGHRVGLHAVYPHVDLDSRFDPVLAWHNPDPAYMATPVKGAVNVMQPGFFDPDRYRSDSNQRWRHGCPHEELARGAFDWLQLLIHPEIWVYPGATMAETMRSLLDAERDLRLRQLREDRIEL